jgi:type IV pilus assembly protein PilV
MRVIRRGRAANARGFTLIEVLIALLLLSIGVLGLAGLQLKALKFNQTAAVRSQATFLAYSIADCMRANRDAAKAGSYNLAMDATAGTGTSISAVDLANWRSALKTQLPSGNGSITSSGDVFTITVQWDESKVDTESPTQKFSFVTQL